MEIRTATTPDDIACAIAIDAAHAGSKGRAGYIATVAAQGGLSIAALDGRVRAFSCLDHGYFFGRPFISLLIVAACVRRLGLGRALLTAGADGQPGIWTSTNRSNAAMRGLLDSAGWQYRGELAGLDDGDPERFYQSL